MRLAEVFGTRILILAIDGSAALANSSKAAIIAGAEISIIAVRIIKHIQTAYLWVTRIVGTFATIVTVQGPLVGALAVATMVTHRASIAVAAGARNCQVVTLAVS